VSGKKIGKKSDWKRLRVQKGATPKKLTRRGKRGRSAIANLEEKQSTKIYSGRTFEMDGKFLRVRQGSPTSL